MSRRMRRSLGGRAEEMSGWSVERVASALEDLEARVAAKEAALSTVESIVATRARELEETQNEAASASSAAARGWDAEAAAVEEIKTLLESVRAETARVVAAKEEAVLGVEDEFDEEAGDLAALQSLRQDMVDKVGKLRQMVVQAELRAGELEAEVEARFQAKVRERELDSAAAGAAALDVEAKGLEAEIDVMKYKVGVLIEQNGGTEEMYPLPLPPPSQYEQDMAMLSAAMM